MSGPRLVLVPARRWDGLRARLHGAALDRRLAGGAAAESDRLLAVRARQLVQRSSRRLAARWRAVASSLPNCAELWQVVELLERGAAPARAVAAAATVLPAVTSSARRPAGIDVAAAAARAVVRADLAT